MLIIAHRGASGDAPENTMAAFKLALKMGARAIEFDVHQTKDSKLAIAHDDSLLRCAGLRRYFRSLTWSEVRGLDIGSWFDKRFSNQRLPKLSAMYSLKPKSVELHLEIKHGSSIYPGIEAKVLEVIKKNSAFSRTLISSFDHQALVRVRQLNPKARLAYLMGEASLQTAIKEMKQISAESLNVSVRQATAELVSLAHRQGFKVYVYTVNKRSEYRRLNSIGVDGIFTNYPGSIHAC